MRNIFFPIFRMIVKPLMGKGLDKIPFVSRLFPFLLQHIVPKGLIEIKVRDHNIYIDTLHIGTGLLMNRGSYETSVTRLLENIIKKGMVVVDIGASVGYHTLTAARLVGEEGKVFSFEPEPYSFELLVKNIKLNGYGNVCAINKAVSNRNGKTSLFVPESYAQKSLLLPHRRFTNGKYIEVDMQTLDDFFQDYVALDVIKIDAEGAEPLILSGMTSIIRSNKKLKIITEFNPKRLRLLGSSPEEYFNMLSGYGFLIHSLNDSTNLIERVDETNILMDYANEGLFTNLYCIRNNSQ